MLINSVSENTGIAVNEIINRLPNACREYKKFNIKKRNGGLRLIAQPSAYVKSIQRSIIEVYLSKFLISPNATAYIKKKSISDNARPHLKSNFILKIDFKDFFPSIKPVDLFHAIEQQSKELNIPPLEVVDKVFILNYLFIKDGMDFHLSIGAPSSPLISNIVMYELDIRIQNECKANDIVYTRYADDIVFSSESYEPLEHIKGFITELLNSCRSPNLVLNESKTRVVSRARSRRVTGVILTNQNMLSVGRTLRKKIRAMLHLYSKKMLKKDDIPYLHGTVSHLKSVEPEFYEKLKKTHGDATFRLLAKQSFFIAQRKRMKIMMNKK